MFFFLQLVAVLREVKYLETEEGKDLPIPEEAAKIFAAKEAFRKYVANLDLTEKWYNKVRPICIQGPFISLKLKQQ